MFRISSLTRQLCSPRLLTIFCGDTIGQYPARFQGFATLPVSSPRAAAYELERSVLKLGLKGALLSGPCTRNAIWITPDFEPIYEAAAQLRVPIYVHPQLPQQAVMDSYYRGFNSIANLMLATGAIGWHYETGVQLLASDHVRRV